MNFDNLDLHIKIKDVSSPTKVEEKLQKKVCEFISVNYPSVYYFSDPSGVFASPRLRSLLHKTHSEHPQLDIFIAEPRKINNTIINCGLFIELKSESPYKQNGQLLSNKHLLDQVEIMEILIGKGYECKLAWSYDQSVLIIERYLGKSKIQDEPLFP